MGRKINRRQFMKTSAKTAGVALTAASVGPFISTSAFAEACSHRVGVVSIPWARFTNATFGGARVADGKVAPD